jgi:prepilin-type N-terminal cleavage/methylation domain-containing protein
MKNIKRKKAFTLIEIIIALVISAMIGAYMLFEKQKGDFTSSVSKFANTLVSMISSGVIDSTVGYVSSSCKGNGSYQDISASNINDCTGWSAYDVGGTAGDDGSKNWFYGINLLGAYTDDGQGCKVYFDEDSSTNDIFYIYVDCSSVDYDGGSSRYKKYVEDRVSFVLKSSLSTMVQDIKRDAVSIDGTTGGSDSDGKVWLELKK